MRTNTNRHRNLMTAGNGNPETARGLSKARDGGWRRRLGTAVLAVVASVLAGCELATSRQPLGKPAEVDAARLEGIWRSADGQVFFVRVTDAASGGLEVATVKKSATGFDLDRTEVLLRRQGEAVLVNLRPAAVSLAPEDYTFGRATIGDEQVVILLAGAEPICRWAAEGGIGVQVTTNGSDHDERHEVVVTNGFERLAVELASPSGWRLLDTENPIVLQRQRSKLD